MATGSKYKYTDIIFEIKGKIGIIKVRSHSSTSGPETNRQADNYPS